MMDPGAILICVKDAKDLPPEYSLPDGIDQVYKGSLYTCEQTHPHGIIDILLDGVCPLCDEVLAPRIHLFAKNGCYCTCMFKPFLDGETTLVEEEIKEPVYV